MANSIVLAEKYLPLLDEVYKVASKTAILDASNTQIKFNGGNKVELFKLGMDGLGDYSRENGYAAGSVTGTWESMTLTQDRSKKFNVDSMDNEEVLGMIMPNLMSEFIRTKVTPEVDAYRFAKYATSAGKKVTTAITDAVEELDAAEAYLGDKEVPTEGRLLFVSEDFYKSLKGKIVRHLVNENGVSRDVETYDEMPVIRVPKGRFNTAVSIGSNGFTPNGDDIDFMIIHPSAVAQVVKHEAPKFISPEVNQTADGWIAAYRLYHDAFILANKVDGIYVHATA